MKPIEILKAELSRLHEKRASLEMEIGDHARKELLDCKSMIRLYEHSIKKLKK